MPQNPPAPQPNTPSRAQTSTPLALIIPCGPLVDTKLRPQPSGEEQAQIAYVQDITHNLIEHSQNPPLGKEGEDTLESVVDNLMLGYPKRQHKDVVRLGLQSVPVVKKGLELARSKIPVEQQAEITKEANRQKRQRQCDKLRSQLDDLWGGPNWLPVEFANGQLNVHQLNNLRTVTKLCAQHNVQLSTLWEPEGLLYRACHKSTNPPRYTVHAAQTALAMANEEYSSTSTSTHPDSIDNEEETDQGGEQDSESISRIDINYNDCVPTLASAINPDLNTNRATSLENEFHTPPERVNQKQGSPELGRRYQEHKDYSGPDLGGICVDSEKGYADNHSRQDSSLSEYSSGNLLDLGSPIEVTDSPPQSLSPSLRDRQHRALSHLQISDRELGDDDMFELIDLVIQVTGAHEFAIADTLWYQPDDPRGPPSRIPQRLFSKTAPTLMPLHHRSPPHWTLVEANWLPGDGTSSLRLSHYDSLTATSRFNIIKRHATAHYAAVLGATNIEVTQMSCPQQSDGHSYGPHVLWMIYHLASKRPVPSTLPSEGLRSFLFDLLAPAVNGPVPQATPKPSNKAEHHRLSTTFEKDPQAGLLNPDVVGCARLNDVGSVSGGSTGRGSGRKIDHQGSASSGAHHSKPTTAEPRNLEQMHIEVHKRNWQTGAGDDFESQKRRMLDFIRADNHERSKLQLAIRSEERTLYWAQQQLDEAREQSDAMQAAWNVNLEEVQGVVVRFQDQLKSMADLGIDLSTSGFAKSVVRPTLDVAKSQLSEYVEAQETWGQDLMTLSEERVHFCRGAVVEAEKRIQGLRAHLDL